MYNQLLQVNYVLYLETVIMLSLKFQKSHKLNVYDSLITPSEITSSAEDLSFTLQNGVYDVQILYHVSGQFKTGVTSL